MLQIHFKYDFSETTFVSDGASDGRVWSVEVQIRLVWGLEPRLYFCPTKTNLHINKIISQSGEDKS